MDHLYGHAAVYEVEFRIRTKDGKYRWYYDRGAITQRDDSGKPVVFAGIVFDITEKKEMQMDLEYKNAILAEMSSIDGLTKISNHATFIEYLKAGLVDADRTNRPLSIASFDIDDFKKVNDSKGHVCGDRVLIDVAAIIRQSIRDIDVTGRYGGEEFMVVFSNADPATASCAAERIRRTVENTVFHDGMLITISGGVKQYKGENLTDLIHATDTNLYEAKKSGKNRIIS